MKRSHIARWLIALVPIVALGLSPAAFAGGKGHGYKSYSSGHHYRHGYRHNSRHGYRHNRHNYRYRSGRSYRHGYRHGRHSSRSSRRGAYLVGGLIAGSLITHALTRSNDRYHRDDYRSTRVVRPRRTTSEPVGRRLFRDRDGNCFERSIDANGDELLIELPARECAW